MANRAYVLIDERGRFPASGRRRFVRIAHGPEAAPLESVLASGHFVFPLLPQTPELYNVFTLTRASTVLSDLRVSLRSHADDDDALPAYSGELDRLIRRAT